VREGVLAHAATGATDWLLALVVCVPAGLVLLAHERGARRLGPRARPGRARRIAFAGGIVLGLAAVSPAADGWAQDRLSAHMVQHVALMLVAPGLLVSANPVAALLRGLPSTMRRRPARWAASLRRALRGTGWPLAIAAVHVAVLWAWHLPGPYEAALGAGWLHGIEHATMALAGVALFAAALEGARVGGVPCAAALAASIGAMFAGAALGVLMTFASSPWYASYGAGAEALTDQRVAGAIMWGPGGVVYALTAALLAWALLRTAIPSPGTLERQEQPGWAGSSR
jgi:putative membrane protein